MNRCSFCFPGQIKFQSKFACRAQLIFFPIYFYISPVFPHKVLSLLFHTAHWPYGVQQPEQEKGHQENLYVDCRRAGRAFLLHSPLTPLLKIDQVHHAVLNLNDAVKHYKYFQGRHCHWCYRSMHVIFS